MGDLKISQLVPLAAGDVVADDVLAIVDVSVQQTKKIRVQDLIASGGGGGGGAVVTTTATQTMTNKTLTAPVINSPTGIVKGDVGLGNVDNTSDVNKPISSATAAALANTVQTSSVGAANGVASLDSGGRIPASQLASTVMEYKGAWNAATNTPTLVDGTGDLGDVYRASVAGTVNTGAGPQQFAVGDLIIYNGSIWQHAPAADGVSSVNGYTGAVVLSKSDVGLANVDNTSDATKNAAVATLTNKTLTAPVINSPTGIVKGDVGLGNVDNTSDATKNAAAVTLTNKTLTAPVINSPTGIVKGDVGLGNVDNTSDVNKPVSTAQNTAITNAAASAQAYAVQRANHTGTQPVSTITGLAAVATSGAKADVGLANVDNTSDATKNAAVATLANKTLTAPAMTGVLSVTDFGATAPTAPGSAGIGQFYYRNGKFYYQSSTVAESQLGGGGLIPSYQNANFTAQPGYKYLVNTTAGTVTATLAAGAALSQMSFSDTNRNFAVNNLIIQPATGDQIAGLGANSKLIVDVSGASVAMAWDTGNTWWAFDFPGYSNLPSSGSGSGSGSGELNLISSPSTVTGWTQGTGYTLATTTSSADLPLAGIVSSAIKITSGTGASTEATLAQTNSFAFTTPASYAVKTKVELWQRPGTNFIASEWTVSVYTAAGVRVPLTTDASGVTYLSTANGKFVTYFDAVAATSYTLRLTRVVNAGANAGVLNVTNVIVGPGIQPQGAIVGVPVPFSPVIAGGATYAANGATYTRIGQYALIEFEVGFTSAATSTVQFDVSSLFSGAAIDYTLLSGSARPNIGSASYIATNGYVLAATTGGPSNLVSFRINGTAQVLDNANPTTEAGVKSPGRLSVCLFVPIASWAGSGTVNLAQTDVQYAYNTSTNVSAPDTTSFGYGPAGFQIGSITNAIVRNVRFPGGFQTGDELVVQISADQQKWVDVVGGLVTPDANYNVSASAIQNGVLYGIGRPFFANATDVSVTFGSTAYAGGATYGAAGQAWSAGAGAYYWRVKKFSGGQAVGFANYVAPSAAGPGQSGLVPSAGLPGQSDGNAIPASVKGQEIISIGSNTGGAAGASTLMTQISLPAGCWDIYAHVVSGPGAGQSFVMCVNTVSASETGCTVGNDLTYTQCAQAGNTGQSLPPLRKNISVPTIYYLNVRTSSASVLSYFTLKGVRQ